MPPLGVAMSIVHEDNRTGSLAVLILQELSGKGFVVVVVV